MPVVYGDKIEHMQDLSQRSKNNQSNILHICQSRYSEPHQEPYENNKGENTICNKKRLETIYESSNVSEIENDSEIWKLYKIFPK